VPDGPLVGRDFVPGIPPADAGPVGTGTIVLVGDLSERGSLFDPPPERAGLFAAVRFGMDLGDRLHQVQESVDDHRDSFHVEFANIFGRLVWIVTQRNATQW